MKNMDDTSGLKIM